MQPNRQWYTYVFALICVIGSAYFITSMYAAANFNDLRNRVVGSRLAAVGKDAYFHKFNPAADSVYLLDPYERREWVVNGNTITPTALALTHSLHILPQHKINFVWLAISCFSFVMVLYHLRKKQSLMPLLVGLGMLVSSSWLLHLFKGQMYILYTLIAVLSIAAYVKQQKFLTIVLATLLFSLRPNSILLLLPVLLSTLSYWKYWFLGIICWALLPILMFNKVSIWPSYFTAMHWHGLENLDQVPEISTQQISIPQTLEGWHTTYNFTAISIEKNIGPDIASVQKLLVQLGLPSSSIVLGLLLALTLFLTFLIVKGKNKLTLSAPNLLLFGAMAYCISDYFLPAVRFGYNFVQILIPFVVINYYQLKISKWATGIAFLGLFLVIKKLLWIPECYTVGEGLMLLSLLLIAKQNYNQPVFQSKNEIENEI